MEKKFFFLDPDDNSRIVKIFQLVLGLLCFGVALYWIYIYLRSENASGSMWITIIFLAGFGFYQVMAGLGKTRRFIETGNDKIIIRQHSFLPAVEMKPSDIELIELHPLSIAFHLKNKKMSVFRFGIAYTDIIQPVKESVSEFASINKIALEEKSEEI